MTGDEEHQAMPQCFAQLSDPHLSSLKEVRGRDLFSKRGLGYLSWRRKRRFEHRTEVLEALQRDLERPDPYRFAAGVRTGSAVAAGTG
jgi:3',5'-cyclic AMP phosphodiesterase CpdA